MLRIAEAISLASAVLVLVVLHAVPLDRLVYGLGIALVAGVVAVTWAVYRRLASLGNSVRRETTLGALPILTLALGAFALLNERLPSVDLVFLPAIVVAGLLGNLMGAGLVALASMFAVTVIGLSDEPTRWVVALIDASVFILTGSIAGLLAQELRDHHRRELKEHRATVAVRHRLSAVIDAVDEGIVFSDRNGIVRTVNQRASKMFGLELDRHLGAPAVQLARVVARQTEDPEGFMETLQELRDEPEAELDFQVEQILPARRIIRVLSRPAIDDGGALVGRIDVYADVTDTVQRAAEAERLYQQARKTAESYQRALLPTAIPKLPRLGLVAHYIPAAGRRAVCGDFYDFLTLPEGEMAVVLGDVCGVGPQAVGDAALTRYTLASFIRGEPDPGRLLELTNLHVSERLGSERFVRVFVGVLDPERAVLEYANAGHVPPLLFRARNGEVQWLGEGGLPLGVEPDAGYKKARVDLEPGDMLFVYTDGVTEAPRSGRPLGQGRLADLVTAYGNGTPGELVQAIRRAVEAWVDDDLRDDLAMVGCQVVRDGDMADPTRELVLPNEPDRLREIRSFVAEFLADLRAPIETSSDILLAASEAAGNAMKYGKRPDGRGELRVRCVLDATDVTVIVVDDGPGFSSDREMIQPMDPFAAGGRGLFLMREMMDELQIDSSSEGTTVRLTRRTFDEPPLPPEGSGE
jgi:serine phosphatase RsbU (regulator of sigma subunit)/anti-sigma regulatory factor (Ser/Thr protein kinase)